MHITDGDIEIRPAKIGDLGPIWENLREADLREIQASDGDRAEMGLASSFAHSSICLTLLHKGVPIGIFGVVLLRDREGACAWMVGTNGINAVKKSFVHYTHEIVAFFLKEYPVLYNYVDVRYPAAIKWLEHAGAKFQEAKPFGIQGLPFQYFEIRRK